MRAGPILQQAVGDIGKEKYHADWKEDGGSDEQALAASNRFAAWWGTRIECERLLARHQNEKHWIFGFKSGTGGLGTSEIRLCMIYLIMRSLGASDEAYFLTRGLIINRYPWATRFRGCRGVSWASRGISKASPMPATVILS